MASLAEVFSFPAYVNEKAARSVAGLVTITSLATLALTIFVSPNWLWLTAALAVGFLARVVAGPSLSPFALLATRVIAPKLGAAKPVPGAPKRFAQGMGFAMTAAAAVLTGFGFTVAAGVLVGALVIAATLESVFALCLGCKIFGFGMRIGLISADACPECADISLHRHEHPAEPLPAHATA